MGAILAAIIAIAILSWLAEGIYTFILETSNFLFHASERPDYIFQYGSIMGFLLGVAIIGLSILLMFNIEATHHWFFRPTWGFRSSTKFGMIVTIPTVIYLTTTRTKTISSWVGAITTVLILLSIALLVLYWIVRFLYEWVIT